MVYDSSKDWVSFEQSSGDLEATSRAKKGESVRRRSKKASSVKSHESWTKKPINSDASWIPVAPPTRDRQQAIADQSNGRTSSRSTTATNPVSSDSSLSSRGKRSSRKVENVSSGSQAQAAVRQVPERSRSRSVKKTPSSSAPKSRSASSRGRSSSRVRNPQAEGRQPNLSSTSRGRSSSRNRTPVATGSSKRTRSNSRNPSSSHRRSRSTSRSSHRRTAGQSQPAPGIPTRQESVPSLSANRTRVRGGGPPATSRTRRELLLSSSSSVGPGLPHNRGSTTRSLNGDEGSIHTLDPNLGRDISFGNATNTAPSSPSRRSGKRTSLMEKLFGNQVERGSANSRTSHRPCIQKEEHIHPRILLTATVYHNTATNLWITTINTNQKGVAKNPVAASKYLKAFSFASEREARESAIANAPPKMLPFAEHPKCHICEGKFAVFRRAGHCRNCGVCVCNSCSTAWPSKMIPSTYNLKKESSVKICKSCDALSRAFKVALCTGNYEDAVALYGTGNINLRTPFPVQSKKDEVMHPIHCAVEGGNVNIVQWLMDDHFCPIKVISTTSGRKIKRGGPGNDAPIITSKGRSVLTIAISGMKIDILRYLVVDCNVSVFEAKDLKSSLRALEAALQALPAPNVIPRHENLAPRWDDQSFLPGADDSSLTSSLGDESSALDMSTANKSRSSKHSNAQSRNGESCIICYDSSIDCVMTPCGHQVCCLKCSTNLTVCPVCNNRGEFIKIFRP